MVSENTTATIDTMAPITSVSELTPIASFGNDIVTIAAGPGGVFGNVDLRDFAGPETTPTPAQSIGPA